MDIGEVVKIIEMKANVDLSVFREPRGLLRVLQFVIGTLAGIAIYGFEGMVTVNYSCGPKKKTLYVFYSYPFQLTQVQESIVCDDVSVQFPLANNDSFSQYAEYFCFICLLSILYCFVAMIVYSKFTASYETDNRYPLWDFIVTVIIAVAWMFAAAAWSHGLSGLKANTNPNLIEKELKTKEKMSLIIINVITSTYFGLNVSAMLGCLCFFIWATNLWFLYKETPWFRGRRAEAVGSPA